MSKYLSGSYPSGYTLNGSNPNVTIGGTASIGGIGLVGGMAASYTILNLGRIAATGTGHAGVTLYDGGTITNGSSSHTTALLQGATGSVGTGSFTVVDHGHVIHYGVAGGAGGAGISLSGGGGIVNDAIIEGGSGGVGAYLQFSDGGIGGFGGAGISLANGNILNHATIVGGTGGNGGSSRNGAGGAGGLGGAGVSMGGPAVLTNSGVIAGGTGGNAIGSYIGYPGRGGAGGAGVIVAGGSVVNNGSIVGGTGGTGGTAEGRDGGNGGGGGYGALLSAGGRLLNSGTIAGGVGGTGGVGFYANRFHHQYNNGATGAVGNGVVVSGGGTLTNQSTGLIGGSIGVFGTSGATVINYGTIASISGSTGTAVSFASASNVLVIEAGSKLVGKAVGGGGTLDLAGSTGPGTLSGFGSQYFGFGHYAVLAGANWMLTGTNTIASGATLTNQGTLQVSGSFDNAGVVADGIVLTVAGRLTNEGTGSITGAGGAGGAPGNMFVAPGSGGTGGAGINGAGFNTLNNAATIVGGTGGGGGVNYNGVGGAGGTGGAGISLADGGSIGNTGTILGGAGGTGGVGAFIDGSVGAVGNAIVLTYGGTVTNGDPTHPAALIEGAIGVQATGAAGVTVNNYGTIIGISGTGIFLGSAASRVRNLGTGGTALISGTNYGVQFTAGGLVTNGASGNSAEIIKGANDGVLIQGASGTVQNYGTIATTVTSGNSFAINLSRGGAVRNSGLLSGRQGIAIFNATGNVTNSGTILGSGYNGVYAQLSGTLQNGGGITGGLIDAAIGVRFHAGGGVINGAAGVYNEIIRGSDIGVLIDGASGSVANFGTITSTATSGNHYGIKLTAGGYLRNATGGLVTGRQGIAIFNSAGSIVNYGTIAGSAYNGVYSQITATVSNRSSGVISGPIGVNLQGGSLFNAGMITGSSDGVLLSVSTAIIRNATTGRIVGAIGVQALGTAAATLINYGAIASVSGTGGTAVSFANATDTLVIEAGSTLVGNVVGGGGTLDLGGGNGAGTFSGLGNSHYSGFGQYGVLAGADWTLTGSNTIASGKTLTVQGTLTATGVLNNAGAVTTNGGKLIIDPATFINSGTVSGAVTLGGGSYLYNVGAVVAAGTAVTGATSANTVVNMGSIRSTVRTGIDLKAGGTITNRAGAYISAAQQGVYIETPATVINAGTIEGNIQGVLMRAGGYVSNAATGVISGAHGIDGSNLFTAAGTATIANSGTIIGTGYGVYLFNGGIVTNTAGVITGATGIGGNNQSLTILNAATIIGTFSAGIQLDTGGTVIDSGTITGGGGIAINFYAGIGNLLALEPGYKLNGSVQANGGATLELAGSSGHPLAVNYHGLSLGGFGDVLFGAGGYNTLVVSNVGGTLPTVIQGFSLSSDIIDLTMIGTNGTISAQSNTSVTITGSLGSETLLLDPSDGSHFTLHSDGADGTEIVACFCRGTMILTDNGEVPIEDLVEGDLLVTVSGEMRAIRWIGRRGYAGRFIAGNRNVLPICVRRDAVMAGVPARDLWVSPEHSMYLDTFLVQAKHLVNGITVVQAESVDEVEYFHIELDSHDVIYADGAPAETFVDCDNRLMFANGREYDGLYPNDDRPRWQFCAPRLEWGSPQLVAIRQWMFDRSGADLVKDPQLHLVVDGIVIAPIEANGASYRFDLPSRPNSVWLRSLPHIPAERDPASFDTRRLGVPIVEIVLASGDQSLRVRHWNPLLRDGFHAAERSHRWTDGVARIPDEMLRAFSGPLTIAIQLAPDARYAAAA